MIRYFIFLAFGLVLMASTHARAETDSKAPGLWGEAMGINGTLASFMIDHNCPGGYRFTVVPLTLHGIDIGQRYVFEDGRNMAELPLKDGKAHGVMRYWSQGGALLAEIPFEGGKLHGTCRFYDRKGHLLGTSEFKQGTGTYKVWRTWGDRALVRERQYVDGLVTEQRSIPGKEKPNKTLKGTGGPLRGPPAH